MSYIPGFHRAVIYMRTRTGDLLLCSNQSYYFHISVEIFIKRLAILGVYAVQPIPWKDVGNFDTMRATARCDAQQIYGEGCKWMGGDGGEDSCD